ncbi:unnamed protein product [Owenia fusiformis]|uniref:Metalloendopeptidase n=1 Tax=Owenia fusiformis TaxID=6347 RepID=A0A8J1UBJ6_OWEFU|nr:unnamed protein product [Owenia fusiformis]
MRTWNLVTLLFVVYLFISVPPWLVTTPAVLGEDITYTNKTKNQSHIDTSKSKDEPPERKGGTLVDVLINLQKIAEEKLGLSHKQGEEKNVNKFFESDIILSPDQASVLMDDLTSISRKKRKLTADTRKWWHLPIPFAFDGRHDEHEKQEIRLAIDHWESQTCIKFVEYNYNLRSTKDFPRKILLFTKESGCWSYVGFMNQNMQRISIGPGCMGTGTIAHEIGHSIGFWHEQSRPDREDYITIHYDNIKDGKAYNFQRRTWKEITDLEVPYDIGSDLHYGSKYFSSNERYTIETKDPLMQNVLGQRQELSFYDVKLANNAYCKTHCDSNLLPQTCQRDGYQDPADCKRCRCSDGFSGRYCDTAAPGVRASCGGVVYAGTGVIYSPGYPNYLYKTGQKCSWLIKAPIGKHIYLRFQDKFDLTCDPDLCKDFVEVRYRSNLGATGARFCCSNLPDITVRSDTNEMMVLFRSFVGNRVGFKAMYFTDTCGGCGSKYPSLQEPCHRSKEYRCTRTWNTKYTVQCPSWWRTPNCGTKYKQVVRYSTCVKDEVYCCGNFALVGDLCRSMSQADQLPVGDQPGTEPSTPGGATIDPSSLWSAWTNWSTCSKSCGGCGKRSRSRTCLSPGKCEGNKNFENQYEDCGHEPCPSTFTRACKVQEKYQVFCNPWTMQMCTRYRSVYKLCTSQCCHGFKFEDKKCIPA